MKIEELESWLYKKYNGYIRLVVNGTEKASEEGREYLRQFLLMTSDAKYHSIMMKGKIFQHIVFIKDGVWHVKNAEDTKKQIEDFAMFVLKKALS